MNKTISILTICILFSLSFISAFDSQTDVYCGGDDEARFLCFGDTVLGIEDKIGGGILFEDGKPTIICYCLICFIVIIIFLTILLLIIKKKQKGNV